jgi:PAS domain S-box-containing protein
MAPIKKKTKEEKSPVASQGTSSLRDAAEQKFESSPSVTLSTEGRTPEEMVHILGVHQIELEMQADELRRTHLELGESRDKYLDLYEFAPIGYLTLTKAALISQANLTVSVLLGVERARLINTWFRELIAPGDLETWDHYFSLLQKSDKKRNTRLMLTRGDGTVFPARFESIRINDGIDGHSIRVAISDISDLIRAEKELHTSEEQVRMQARMLDAVGDAVIAVDTGHKVIFWNEAATRIYGWKPEEVMGRHTVEIMVPEISRGHAMEIMAKLDKGEIWSGEYTVHHRDGHEFPVHVTDSPVFDKDGNIVAIIGVSHDISERKRAEEVLRLNEKTLLRSHDLLEAVTKGADVIIAAQDTNFRYIFFNQAYKDEITRLTGKELSLGDSMVELFAELPEEQKNAVNEWSKVLNGINVNQVLEFGDPGTRRRVYHVIHTPLRDADGTIIGAGEVAYDVTKQVQVEDKLRELQEYLDSLISYANAPIIVWDPEFRITRFNCAFEHLTGRKATEVIGKRLEMLLPDAYLAQAMDLIRRTTVGERWESVEIPILHKEGGVRTVLWNSAAITGNDGKTIISTIAQGQDITERKKIEAEFRLRAIEYAKMNVTLEEEIRQRKISDSTLKKTLSLLNASLEATADGILVVDPGGLITSYNQNFMAMWNIPRVILDSGEDRILLDYILPQLKSPDDFLTHVRELYAHPTRESYDMIEFNDGKIFERYSKPQKLGDMVVGRVWSFRDVTDRKHAEDKLVASVREKEVLLREIHHRVKNNLQLISGLLDMTRMRTADDATNQILTDIMLKIQTMAQIHTRLYESKQFGKIGIIAQCRDQVTALSNIFSHKGHEITCEIHSEEIYLPVDQALPCALIINEILSNAYKHAFKGQNSGTIEISAVQGNGQIQIIVRDDGVGLPGNFDINHSNSLGLKLIRTLVEHQLKGSLLVKSHHGTKITIEFPVIPAGTE